MRRGSRSSARGGPGLLRTVGRTTVIAGTATAVSRSVSGAMDSAGQQRAVAEQQQAVAEQQRFDAAVQQALEQQAPTPASAPHAGGADRIMMLQQLAELRAQSILTDAEFEAEKARILSS